MVGGEQVQDIDFTINKQDLYREDSVTDLKKGAIRRLTPINADGTEDKSRTAMFIGHTQLMSPEGPIPIQTPLDANSLEEAIDIFPEMMQRALSEVVENFLKMQKQEQHQKQQKDDSRIIIPGR